MESVFLVSAGMLRPKKNDTIIARRHYYLNYGLLNLSAKLFEAGIQSKVIHGLFRSPEDVLIRLTKLGYNDTQFPLLISLPSFFSVPWGSIFCKLVKNRFPNQFIIVGGRWVVNNRVDYIYNKIPEIDLIVCGTSEDCIVQIVTASKKEQAATHLTSNKNKYFNYDSGTPDICINYSLLDEAHKFNPSIEVSRGCGMGCAFCEERNSKLKPLLPPKHVAEHLECIATFYGTDCFNAYLEASNFLPSINWAKEFCYQKQNLNLSTHWRCETRVDTINPKALYFLAKSGLKVMDIGLESASPIQLQRMGKTKNAKQYLLKASELLNILSDLGIWAKINILLYPGETLDTIEETITWLDNRSHQIKGVSVGPLTLFGVHNELLSYVKKLIALGAELLEPKEKDVEGITKLNLSDEISSFAADEISLKISRMFMNPNDYYDLKAFSYFARDYTYENFQSDIMNSDINLLSFSLLT